MESYHGRENVSPVGLSNRKKNFVSNQKGAQAKHTARGNRRKIPRQPRRHVDPSSDEVFSTNSPGKIRPGTTGAERDPVIKLQNEMKVLVRSGGKCKRIALRNLIDVGLTESYVARSDKLNKLRTALAGLKEDEANPHGGETSSDSRSNVIAPIDKIAMCVFSSSNVLEKELPEESTKRKAKLRAIDGKSRSTKSIDYQTDESRSKTPATKETLDKDAGTIRELYENKDYLKLLDVILDHNFLDLHSLDPNDCLTKVIDGVEVGFINVGPGGRSPSVRNSHDNLIFYACEGEGIVNAFESNVSIANDTKFMIPAGTVYNIENTSSAPFKLIVIKSPAAKTT